MEKKVALLEINLSSGVITPEDLPNLLGKVKEIVSNIGYNKVFVISGRMPVWAFCSIAHELHPSAAVGTYDPRLNGAVITQTHTAGFKVGDVINIEDAEKIEINF